MSRSEAELHVQALYRTVDRKVQAAGPICTLSGFCCDFPRSGQTLFATALETDMVLSRGEPPAPERRGWCPFYRRRLCTLRELRPLGCRIYFCDSSFQASAMSDIAESAHRELQRIHDEHDVPYRYAPFLDLLAERRSAP